MSPAHAALTRLARLQSWRGRRSPNSSIADSIDTVVDNARRTQRRLGELAELWQELLPAEIVHATALAGMRGGVLHVTTDSAAISFELDRLLRSGIESELRTRFRGTLVRIRIRVEPIERHNATHRPSATGDKRRSSSKRAGRGATATRSRRSPDRRRNGRT